VSLREMLPVDAGWGKKVGKQEENKVA
jgi:hypothetical protein